MKVKIIKLNVIELEKCFFITLTYEDNIFDREVFRKDFENCDGQFMKFEMLTFVPIDLELIDTKCLDERTKDYLNEYHRQVYEKVSPYLTEEERCWLKENTKNVDSFY